MTYESEFFLVSLDDCKSYLEIDDTDDDNIIGYLMNVVSKLFDTYTDRTLVAADITEYHEGYGTDTLFLNSYPVNSTTSTIEVYRDADRVFGTETKIDGGNLFLDADAGKLVYVGSRFDRPIKVVYNAGYTTVPYDLRGAALEALGVLYKRRQEGRFDTSTYSRDVASYTYLDQFPHTVMNTLKRYRR